MVAHTQNAHAFIFTSVFSVNSRFLLTHLIKGKVRIPLVSARGAEFKPYM